jgi:hypothetical protein
MPVARYRAAARRLRNTALDDTNFKRGWYVERQLYPEAFNHPMLGRPKGRPPLFWSGSCAARGKIIMKFMPIKSCVICVVYTYFTNLAAGLQIQPGGPQFGVP